MDGFQSYVGLPSSSPHRPALPGHHTHHAPLKSAADYLRALRKRVWLVLLVALVVGPAGTLWVLRMPPTYQASAQMSIEPPRFDMLLTGIVSEGVGHSDPHTMASYIPNRLTLLRSRSLAEKVAGDPRIAQGSEASAADPAAELYGKVITRQVVPNTGFYEVSLEGSDAGRTTRLLNTLLERFERDAKEENAQMLDISSGAARRTLEGLRKELTNIDIKLTGVLQGSTLFAPGGKNLLADQWLSMNTLLQQKKARHDQLTYEKRLAEVWPNAKGPPAQTPQDVELAELERERKKYASFAQQAKRAARNPKNEPANRSYAQKLAEISDRMQRLEASKGVMPDLSGMALNTSEEEINNLTQEVQGLLKQLQESFPKQQEYLTLLSSREDLVRRISTLQTRLESFGVLVDANAVKKPVTVTHLATEPTVPIRPNRPFLIGIVVAAGLALGCVLVGLLEHLDHSVKAPEQLSAGLTLPLFGVIPRIKRTAQLDRGGHLYAIGSPGSQEADCYRNLRASLLGAAGPRGPIVTLLVTSAKAGEGKSTTALNLAATCARAGERTLLMDVDLRRPSLGDVFRTDMHTLGLVDILRGDVPWQRALVRTDIPNLDFLPTGDTFDIPIEIVGTLELRQLVNTLARHYDRVILDGPAVLGMADCRMLGRIVDAALMVVRSGAHDLRPHRRAKSMLEQSQVLIAGVVFNGLSEDLKNWSSYGGYGGYGEVVGREFNRPRGLPSPAEDDDPSTMAAAGTTEA